MDEQRPKPIRLYALATVGNTHTPTRRISHVVRPDTDPLRSYCGVPLGDVVVLHPTPPTTVVCMTCERTRLSWDIRLRKQQGQH